MCSVPPTHPTPHYLLSWPPRSSPWSSCGRQQPGQLAAPADTRPGQQLPTEPPGGTQCSDLKQRAEKGGREGGGRRLSLIIHSHGAKKKRKKSTTVKAVSLTIISPFDNFAVCISCDKNPESSRRQDMKANVATHLRHHRHIISAQRLTFKNQSDSQR